MRADRVAQAMRHQRNIIIVSSSSSSSSIYSVCIYHVECLSGRGRSSPPVLYCSGNAQRAKCHSPRHTQTHTHTHTQRPTATRPIDSHRCNYELLRARDIDMSSAAVIPLHRPPTASITPSRETSGRRLIDCTTGCITHHYLIRSIPRKHAAIR